MELIVCPICRRQYPDNFLWYVCPNCANRCCPSCLNKQKGPYGIGFKCGQCFHGMMKPKQFK